MLEPELKTTAKQAMFLNLLFKSLKKDVVERRVKVSERAERLLSRLNSVHIIAVGYSLIC